MEVIQRHKYTLRVSGMYVEHKLNTSLYNYTKSFCRHEIHPQWVTFKKILSAYPKTNTKIFLFFMSLSCMHF